MAEKSTKMVIFRDLTPIFSKILHHKASGRLPAKIGLKNAEKPQNRRFFTQRPPKWGLTRTPWGLNLVGMVLKVVGGNFVHTVQISGQLN